LSPRLDPRLTLALLLIPVLPLFADGSAVTSMSSLKLTREARPAALGEAYSAIADGPDAMNWNPAGLTALRLTEVQFDHLAYIGGINTETLEVGMPIYGLGAWGLGASYLYSQDEGRDSWGKSTGSFSTTDLSMMASLALEWRPVSFGLTYRLLREDSAGAMGMGSCFNFGVQARGLLDKRLDLGLAGQNFGTPMSMGKEVYPLPMTWRGGAAWALLPQWKLAVEFSHQPIDFFNKWHYGTEYSLDLGSSRALALRAGYIDGPQSQLGDGSGFSAGLGLTWDMLRVDYAATSMGDFGLAHRMGMVYTFSND